MRLPVAGAVCLLVVLVAAWLTGAFGDALPVAPSLAGGTSSTSPVSPSTPATPTTDLSTATTPSTTPTPTTPTTPTTPPVTAADPLTIVALGDSVPSATTCDCTGYVEGLGATLHGLTGRPVTVHNDATDGFTTADVDQDLSSPSTSSHLSRADLVVVEVGANDFDLDTVDDPSCLPATSSPCWAATMADLRAGLAAIVTKVRSLDARPDLRIAVVGYWNVTVDGAVGEARGEAFVTGSDALTRAVNAAIEGTAEDLDAVYVDAYTPLKGDGSADPTTALLDDGDHPNAKGHAIIAAAVLGALRSAGAVAGWTPPGGP
ncbi:MAG: hydrolase family protein [Humibacillus sp.]|nr:hydrolase family protein [Humibacillus sp.]